MREIQALAKNLRELLDQTKYAIEYYQREYRWQQKQVKELIEDLSNSFLDDYRPNHERGMVEGYGHYFLGSIIVNRKDNLSYLIDGQQRLTTLTLLLIYLHSLQRGRPDANSVEDLVFSERYGRKSFNIDVPDRTACMEALFDDRPFDPRDHPEAVQNMVARYGDIKDLFPADLTNHALPYFVDWLKENVHLVEITAFTDEDAYTIFETMNDRGLSLNPTEMLKGFLLSNISDSDKRTAANNFWKQRVSELSAHGKDVDADFFKAWLRSQYAETIRDRSRGATPEDFDRIGTEFHRWVNTNKDKVGLNDSASYVQFVDREFAFYSSQYRRLMEASTVMQHDLKEVFYNAQAGFTLQYMLLLAPLSPIDSDAEVNKKLNLVAAFIDILIARRLWNFRSIAYSTMQYNMFLVTREIRRKSASELVPILKHRLEIDTDPFTTNDRLSLHQQNHWFIHRLLARMIAFIEDGSDTRLRYLEYTTGSGQERYEIEHIWADKPDRHIVEFPYAGDFREYRNRIGGLLLVPRSFNESYGALSYTEKLPHYNAQNLLARSLNPMCYERNSGFTNFLASSGLPFRAHTDFQKADLDARQDLYRLIAEQIWDPAQLSVD